MVRAAARNSYDSAGSTIWADRKIRSFPNPLFSSVMLVDDSILDEVGMCPRLGQVAEEWGAFF